MKREWIELLIIGIVGTCAGWLALYMVAWAWVIAHRLSHELCGWFIWGCVG